MTSDRIVFRPSWLRRPLKSAEDMQPLLVGGRVIYHAAINFYPCVGEKGRWAVADYQTGIDAVFS